MDERRVELQIQVIRVTYRIERMRRDSSTMQAFRERARSILDGLESEAQGKPELQANLARARDELDGDGADPS